jgi:hypothetical protein
MRVIFGVFWLIDGSLKLQPGMVQAFPGLIKTVASGQPSWSVPEGFGGPYGPGSTDVGTGIVYALTSLLFLLIIGIFGTSPYSLDYQIEKRFPAWKRVGELRKIVT